MSTSEPHAFGRRAPARVLAELLRAVLRDGMLSDQLALIALTTVVNLLGFAFQFVMVGLMEPAAWKDMFAVLALLALISVPNVALNTLAIKMTGELHVRRRSTRLWRWVLRTAIVVAGAGAAVAVGLALASAWISDLLHLQGNASVAVAGLAFVLMLTSTVVRGALAGVHRFVMMGLLGVTETLVRLLAAVAMVLAGFAAAGAVGGSAAGAFVVVVGGLAALRRGLRRDPVSDAPASSQLPRWDEQMRIMAISLVLAALLNLDIVFVNHFFDEAQAASYSAMALIGRSIFFVASPVSVVLLPYVIRAFAAGRSLAPSLMITLGLIAGLLTAAAGLVLLFPSQVFGLVFREGYTLDPAILTIYVGVGAMLAVNTALAHFHIGVGHLRPWKGLMAITAVMVAGMLGFHAAPVETATVLLAAVTTGVVYLGIETVLFLRRMEPREPAEASA